MPTWQFCRAPASWKWGGWHCCSRGQKLYSTWMHGKVTRLSKPSHLSQLSRNTRKYVGRNPWWELRSQQSLCLALLSLFSSCHLLPLFMTDSFSSFRTCLRHHLLREALMDCSSKQPPPSILFILLSCSLPSTHLTQITILHIPLGLFVYLLSIRGSDRSRTCVCGLIYNLALSVPST